MSGQKPKRSVTKVRAPRAKRRYEPAHNCLTSAWGRPTENTGIVRAARKESAASTSSDGKPPAQGAGDLGRGEGFS